MPNTREMRIEQVEDILAKWEFFYGQRAGRELWAEKPKDVQEKDIEAFNRDISFVRDFVRGVTIQKWIPVTERLPEDDLPKDTKRLMIRCIVYTDKKTMKPCVRQRYKKKIDGQWVLCPWEWNKDVFAKPTHWMPLPEPPKEA